MMTEEQVELLANKMLATAHELPTFGVADFRIRKNDLLLRMLHKFDVPRTKYYQENDRDDDHPRMYEYEAYDALTLAYDNLIDTKRFAECDNGYYFVITSVMRQWRMLRAEWPGITSLPSSAPPSPPETAPAGPPEAAPPQPA